MTSRRLLAIFAAVAVAHVARSSGQQGTQQTPQTQPPPQQAQRQPPQPSFRTDVNFVRVDVYPTANGKPVMDLTAQDFEVFEDGRPQTIESFEHVTITATGAQPTRRDPNTVEEARQAAANPRARVFIIFLDRFHVTIEGAWHSREPLIRFIDRVVGPEDVVAVMTPEMSPAQLTFTRKTEVIERGLRDGFPWGQRFTMHNDEREEEYRTCYRVLCQEAEKGRTISELAAALIVRRRELMTLEAFKDLVMYLRTLREERKAVITLTEGWTLYRPNPKIMELRKEYCAGQLVWEEPVPGRDPIGVGPGGRITRGDPRNYTDQTTECDGERARLAQMDNQRFFSEIIDDANRANVTFYPVDPRGLAAFDTPLGKDEDELARPLTIVEDRASLRTRQEAMANLASGTDGLAVMNSNDLDIGFRRIADDLSSYYLLGYASTNTKLDGRFRSIRVRVKRPGVDVRARRGYRAPTEEEVKAARTAAERPGPTALSPVAAALASLANVRPEVRFRVHAAPWGASNAGITTVWVAGELLSIAAGDPWAKGGTAEIDVTAAGATTTARVTIAPGERGFLTNVALPKPVAAGPVEVRARLIGTDAAAPRLADTIRPAATPGAAPPLLFRRGPTTGNRLQPAASFQFSRSERVRVEVPLAGSLKPAGGRLFDKTGQPLAIPVTVGERTDAATGQRWLTADVVLAPLGAGDYAIEVAAAAADGERKTVTAIRVVR